MELSWLLVFAGAFIGGFVSGLSGFGTGLAGMPFWLLAVQPVVAAQLAAFSAVISQAQTLGTVRHSLSWHHLGPMTLAGIVGVPIGVWLLPHVPVSAFKTGIGVTLIVFCAFQLVVSSEWRLKHRYRPIELIMGLAGGFMGGLFGVPGPPVIMWGTIQNWSREQKRALYQVFILAILFMMLVASAVSGLIGWAFIKGALLVAPATVLGAYCGEWLYRRVDDRRFDRIILTILMLSGIGLVVSR